MAVHSIFDTDNDMDSKTCQSRIREELATSTGQSPMTVPKFHSRHGKDALLFTLCFVLAMSATLMCSNVLTRGRKYSVSYAAIQLLIFILSLLGVISLVVMIFYNWKERNDKTRPLNSDHNDKRQSFRGKVETILLYIFGFTTICHFFLKIVWISYCIRVGDNNEGFALVMYLSLGLFCMAQLLHFFTYNDKKINRFQSHFTIMFVVCTNISVGFSVLIQETVDILDELENNTNHQHDLNSTETLMGNKLCGNSSLVWYMELASNFLYPFVTEYLFLSTELLWYIWKIPFPKLEFVELVGHTHQSYNTTNSEETPLINSNRASTYYKWSQCRVFLIVSITFCVLTVTVTFIAYFKDGIPLLHSTFIILELIFSFLLLFSCGGGVLLVISEDKTSKKKTIIGNWLSFFLTVGSVSAYHIFSIISSITLLFNNAKIPSSSLMYPALFTDVFHIVAAYLQSLFLGHCSKINVSKLRMRQPIILKVCVFVALANSSIWIENSFLPIRKIDNDHLVNDIDSEFYGVVAWALMSKVMLPFCLYFRLESVIRSLIILRRI